VIEGRPKRRNILVDLHLKFKNGSIAVCESSYESILVVSAKKIIHHVMHALRVTLLNLNSIPCLFSPGLMTSPCLTRNSLFVEPSSEGIAGPVISLDERFSKLLADEEECKRNGPSLLAAMMLTLKDPATRRLSLGFLSVFAIGTKDDARKFRIFTATKTWQRKKALADRFILCQ